MANVLEDIHISSQLLDAVEVRQDTEEHKSLRVHMLAKENVFAEIFNREVVFPTHCQYDLIDDEGGACYIWVDTIEARVNWSTPYGLKGTALFMGGGTME